MGKAAFSMASWVEERVEVEVVGAAGAEVDMIAVEEREKGGGSLVVDECSGGEQEEEVDVDSD